MTLELKGVYAALTTPFVGDHVSSEKFEDNLKKYNATGLAGYVVSGSTGEGVFLSDDESEILVKAAKETASQDKQIIVGTSRESAKHTLEFTNRMADHSIDAALIRTPSYFRPFTGQDSLRKYYLYIADRSQVPVVIYNIPKYTNIMIDRDLLIELSFHPKIAGIKDSSGNLAFLGDAVPFLGPDFNFLLGAGSAFLPGLVQGAAGGILALASVAPEKCVQLFDLYQEDKIHEARLLQHELIPLNKALIDIYGIPGIKYALDLSGYFGGPPRLPLLPLAEEDKKRIEEILRKLCLV